ncbi:hypothetical protein HID58_092946 [Brassica napus]|uniref:Uncharacterized protein n=1 Tax=Brassica napus TaxID=3708 RepID=A0ABQ7X111_BRANA|nr:hypothetical protein HID58_090487 [Brassica napus]KAH0853716.1 hypothetical protein HID58_092946 [Brassica napus]
MNLIEVDDISNHEVPWFETLKMDPKQPVVLQILESLKDSYMSNDFKTCQQLLGQLKDTVDQKASLDGTDNEQQQLGELSNLLK